MYLKIKNKNHFEYIVLVPDEMIIKALSEKLGQLDAVKQGWVLHGFPTSRTQVDAFSCAGYEPNRVIVLDVSSETAVERLNLRCIDPKTGDRWVYILLMLCPLLYAAHLNSF